MIFFMAKKNKKKPEFRNVAQNKKARVEYSIEDLFEAGLVLYGTEVKSLRLGKASLSDSYAKINNGELWLVNCHISPYSHSFYDNHDPLRKRKLLMKKQEIRKITGKINERGYSLIPLRIYFNKKGFAKVEVALAKGKKFYDKRETLKRKTQKREMEKAIKDKTHHEL